MKLSVIIPAYNEARTIEEIVRRVCRVDLDKEVVIVDDFSTDGTREKLSELKDLPNVRAFYHDRNRGKGAALRTGFAAATGDIVIIQDADLEYDPEDYHKLIKPILDGKADVVFGSRFIGGDSHRVLYFWHSVGNKFLTFLSNSLTNLNLTDMEVCYKVFRREVIQSVTIEEDRFGFEPEVTAKVAAMGCRIYEVGISYSGRTYGEGKKINWKDGVLTLWCILKYNLSSTRVKAAVLLLTLSALISVVQTYRGAHISAEHPTDEITLYGRRFKELKKALPSHGVVGYVGDESGDGIPWNYYRTQYSLSPLVVDRAPGSELVVGNFRDSNVAQVVIAQGDLTLLKDFGDGVMLFRKEVK